VARFLNIKLKGEISMKRAFVVAAAAGLAFAACGGSDDPAAEPADQPTATEPAAEPAATEPAAPAVQEEAAAPSGLSVDTINVAYFEQWPTPNLVGFNDGSFDAAVGAEINWVPFGGGGEMSEAMAAGDIDISYSQGLTPFANTVNNGADIKLVGIAVAYAEADNCVAQGALGVTRDNAAEVLDGATVMTPSGNVTNFKMLSMMDFLGVDIDSLNILPTDGGATTLAAFAAGDIDVGCSFGGSLVAMLEDNAGELIMTGAEQVSDIGINTYDIVSIPTSFGEEHPEAVIAFLKATEQFNNAWAADPDGSNAAIAEASGMEDVGNFLAGPTWFSFPNLADQLTADWLGGTVAANMTEQIQTFVDLGQIDSTIGDFSGSIDGSFLEAAIG
jgi:taurine transport system substrate-binding protein